MERALREDLKENCLQSIPPLPPCEDFTPIYEQHQALCAKMALPKRVGDVLKAQLADCIAMGVRALGTIEEALQKYKGVSGWAEDVELKGLVAELEAQKVEQAPILEAQKKQLAALPEECLKPLALDVYFERQSNAIKKKDDKQLKEIADFLIANPLVKARLIGNTSINSSVKNDNKTEELIEKVETRHLMPDDKLPDSWSATEKESYRNRSFVIRDMMLIRASHISELLEKMGVKANQLTPTEGKNLGKDGDNQKDILNNQKVILEFY